MADTANYSGSCNGNDGRPEASFLTSAWYSSAARCCACDTAASTRSSSISMSPCATAWGSIVIARIWPRPSAVACTMPPPADAVTVCCASWDWISDSRNCICCPNCSRLDKSAIRRKLPLAETGGKLLQQLQVQRLDGGVEARIPRPQRREPVGPDALFGHARRAGLRPLSPRRALQFNANRLRGVTSHHVRDRVPLALEALEVHRVGVEQPDRQRGPLDLRDLGGLEQRAEQRALRAGVLDNARPERAEPVDRHRTLLRWGKGRCDCRWNGRGRGSGERCCSSIPKHGGRIALSRPFPLPRPHPRLCTQRANDRLELDRPPHHRPPQQQQLHGQPRAAAGAQLRLHLRQPGEQAHDVGRREQGAGTVEP